MQLTFAIKRWDIWIPGVRGYQQWQQFLRSKKQQDTNEPFANVEYQCLKPAQIRRLSDISKITLDVALNTGKAEQVPAIFASRRGEVSRIAQLLSDICVGEELSPTAFSMSVHNTTSGLYSIQSVNRSPSTTIAGGHDTVMSGLVTVATLLASGQPEVLLVITEDRMPDIYHPFMTPGEQPVAAAFLLTPGDDISFEKLSVNQSGNIAGTSDQVIEIIKTIITGDPGLICGERMHYQIYRTGKHCNGTCSG